MSSVCLSVCLSCAQPVSAYSEVQHELQNELASALSSDDTEQWPQFKSVVYNTATKVIGFRRSFNKDWFDDQDTEACQLLDDMHGKHLAWINDKGSSAKKSAYTAARSAAQKRLIEANERVLVVSDGRATTRCRRSTRYEVILRWTQGSLWSQGHGQHFNPLAGRHDPYYRPFGYSISLG